MATPNLQDLISKGGCGQEPRAGVATRKAFVTYYACVIGKNLPGTYQGNDKTYKGYSWKKLYTTLAAKFPNTDPKSLAQQVLGIYAAQAVAQGIGATVNITGQTVIDTGKAALATFGQTPSPGSPCIISFPSVNLAVTSVGGGCILTKTEARALLGGLVIAGSAIIGFVGIALLAAYGLGKSGALGKAADAAAVVPGGQAVAAGLAVAQSRVTRTGQQSRQIRAGKAKAKEKAEKAAA